MANKTQKKKGHVIAPEQGNLYPTIELGLVQEFRLLHTYVDGTMERISRLLEQFLRSVGCLRVEPLELAFRELSPAEREQWVWCAALAPHGGRARKMFRFGVHRSAVTAMTETALGLKPGTQIEVNGDQPPSETERRFLNRMGQALTQGVKTEYPALHDLDWQQQPTDAPEKKGLCLTLRLVFQEQSWPLTLHWHMAFSELLEKVTDQKPMASPITRAQLEASLRKIPVQLRTTLFSTKLTMVELEQFLRGEVLPIAPLERVSLGCGSFSIGGGQLYDRNGHLAFQLHDVSQQTP
ncbi:hypothetical protein NNO04_14840 [Citrobacter sp. Awk 4]|uniref:FliM/FliN family flagellar motor switch protein n=1 Tax=Citrobacter sp. Awk 4 TaxID=2963955 RepID=UPI002302D4C8|nr:FliM/FliN family flagellar motor switch protein [Citrobacter sp. Awk 4]MDA8479974.1 hypothetical protein [Citrobacter sp. Awk 4]